MSPHLLRPEGPAKLDSNQRYPALDGLRGAGLLAIALNAFVLYGLFTYGFVFKAGQSPR